MIRRESSGCIFGGLIFGAVLFFGSFVLHWWNEGNAVKQFKTIGDLDENTVEVSADQVESVNDGRPVYLAADTATGEELRDDVFGIGEVALRLRRKAEMYQWKETEKKDSDSNKKTYSYSKVWSDNLIKSSQFHRGGHDNPGSMPYRSHSGTAKDVSFGSAFKMPKFLVEDLDNFEPLAPGAEMPDIEGIQSTNNGFYIGANPGSPVIGDVRVSFAVVRPGPASLIAAQAGNSFKRWTSPKTGREIHKIMAGTHTKQGVIDLLTTEAKMLLWGLRVGGVFVMFFGLLLLASPLSSLANFVPFLGRIVGAGIAIMAGLLATILSLFTITIAWIAHRPVLGITLLVVIGLLLVLVIKQLAKGKQKLEQKQLQQATAGPYDTPPPIPPEE